MNKVIEYMIVFRKYCRARQDVSEDDIQTYIETNIS